MRKDKHILNRRGIAGGQPMIMAGILALLFVIVLGGAFIGYKQGWFGNAKLDAGATGGSGSQVVQVEAAKSTSCQGSDPAYVYAGVDAFAGGTVPGTDYIKQNTDYPVSSLAAPAPGAALQYWKSNASYFCEVAKKNAICGPDSLQTLCYQNGTVTQSVYDNDNRVTLSNSATAGSQNVTIGANEQHHLELDFTATTNKAQFPLGGCVAVEYPSTLQPPVITGDLEGSTCPFTWTYTPSSTANTYKLYGVPAGWDVNLNTGKSSLKKVGIELDSSGTNPSGVVYITARSANNYLVTANSIDATTKQTLRGTYALDLEQSLNSGSTTQTMPGQMQTVFVVQ